MHINRFSLVLVVTNVIYVVNISDGTSCWTVILINDRVASLLRIMGVPVELYICCRPLVGRLFSWFMIYVSRECPHIIRVFPSNLLQVCLGFFYGPVDLHSGKLRFSILLKCFLMLYCVSYW